MNEHDVERALRDWIEEDTNVPEPSGLRERVMAVPESAEARTHWRWSWLGGWLRVRPLTASVAAAAVLVLLVVALVPLGSTREPAALVVARDGSGEYATISDAVAAAADGDTVLVRPGTYVESILIAKDITLRGDGDRDRIVITSPMEVPRRYLPRDEEPYAIRLDDADVSVENLRLTGEASSLIALGSSSRLKNVAFVDTGLVLSDGSTAQVRHSLFRRSGIFVDPGSDAALEDNELDVSGIVVGYWGPGQQVGAGNPSRPGADHPEGIGTLVKGNVFADAEVGISVGFGVTARIEDNEIRNSGNVAVWVLGAVEGSVIQRNTISDGKTAIMVVGDTQVTVTENEVSGNQVGLNISGRGATVGRNEIRDNTVGVVIASVDSGTSPTLEGNDISGNVRGISISAGASPVLRDNVICGNDTNLNLVEGANASFEDNEICADGASAEAP